MSETDGHPLPVPEKILKEKKDIHKSKGISSLKQAIRQSWGNRLFYVEMIIIFLWVLCLTHKLMDFNPRLVPVGREYFHILQYNYIWTLLPKCGSCVIWNGFMNGGAPSFIDIHGPSLHPLTIITTLLYGVANGGKALIFVSIFMAAMAQWWMAKVMGLRRVIRVWSACLVAAGGHLAGRMEIGNVGLVLSTASAGLVLAALLDLTLNKEKRSPVALGVTLALLMLSGQGYLQLGTVILFVFWVAFFYFRSGMSIQGYLREYAMAVVLAFLLIGYFLIPFLHFLPHFAKETDPNLTQIQVTEYLPLNLVIHDIDFYKMEVLDKSGNAYLYNLYIGWLPILFAGFAIRLVPERKKQLLVFFLLATGLVFLISGKLFYQVLQGIIPAVDRIRNASLISGLVVPIVVALAAWGVDLLLEKDWGRIVFMRNGNQRGGVSLSWIIIPLLLAISLYQVFQFSHSFLYQVELNVSLDEYEALFTPSAEWIQPPFGEFFWLDDVFNHGMKIANVFRPWRWEGREIPPAYRELTRNAEDKEKPGFVGQLGGVYIIENIKNEYASIKTKNGGFIPCEAAASGGKIDVVCDVPEAGILTVLENNYSGWKVWVNGQREKLLPSEWLSIVLPPGSHAISFRYRPWDVVIGTLTTLLGIAFAVWLSSRKSPQISDNNIPG